MKRIVTTYLPIAMGLFMLLVYLLSTTGLFPFPRKLAIISLLALGPIAIFGIISIAKLLTNEANAFMAEAGKVFGILAFAILEMFLCIQFGTRTYFREHLYTGDLIPEKKEMLDMVYNGVNSIQFTMDIAFDVFYCLSIIIFSGLMIGNRYFGRIIGIFGILAGSSLLIFNMWKFPYPPAESGLVDLGPVTGIWWVVVIVMMMRAERKDKRTIEKSNIRTTN